MGNQWERKRKMKPTNCHDEESCCEEKNVSCDLDECICEEEENCKINCEYDEEIENSCCGGECCSD